MNVGSLFTGIGGIDLGLERAGMHVAWQCESDPYCRRVLERHWPDVPCYEDVRTLHAPERVDVLAGGFPCQDVSQAGQRAGIDGERSGLWTEFARLIRELEPRFVFVENVPGLLVRGMGTVLGDLAACGYDAEWDCVPAAAVGAPHLRARIFVLAYPGSGRRSSDGVRAGRDSAGSGGAAVADAELVPRGKRPEPSEVGRRSNKAEQAGMGGGSGRVMADSERAGLQGLARRGVESARWTSSVFAGVREGFGGQWEPEPDVGRVAHGVPHRVDRLRSLGNAVVPQVAEWIGRRMMEAADA